MSKTWGFKGHMAPGSTRKDGITATSLHLYLEI